MENRIKGTIKEYMERFNIPSHFRFIGFCVHHEKRDEFLYRYKKKRGSYKKVWSQTPELSIRYKDQLKAEKIALSINDGSIMALLFDDGIRIHVSITD